MVLNLVFQVGLKWAVILLSFLVSLVYNFLVPKLWIEFFHKVNYILNLNIGNLRCTSRYFKTNFFCGVLSQYCLNNMRSMLWTIVYIHIVLVLKFHKLGRVPWDITRHLGVIIGIGVREHERSLIMMVALASVDLFNYLYIFGFLFPCVGYLVLDRGSLRHLNCLMYGSPQLLMSIYLSI